MEPEKPIVHTTPAAHMAAIVSRRIRGGVSHGMFWLCIQVLKPLAAEAAAIAQPAHIPVRVAPGAARARLDNGMSEVEEQSFRVSGMSCEHCAAAVSREVGQLPGVSDVHVDLARGGLVVRAVHIDGEAIRAAVESAGYTLAG